MNVKDLLIKLRTAILTYNEFPPEENEYDDDVEENINTSEQILKRQLYSTRLYILLLYIILILLFNPQTLVMTIDNPSISTYQQLYDQHSSTLTCPCSSITISYKLFVSMNYSIHPLCNFITEEWIMSFYIHNSSYFGHNTIVDNNELNI